VIAATDSLEVNTRVSEHAQTLGIPVNVVDQPELCTFIVPAIVDRSPILVAISSGGASPILARSIKGLIDSLLPARVDRLAALLRELRAEIKKKVPDFSSAQDFGKKFSKAIFPSWFIRVKSRKRAKKYSSKLTNRVLSRARFTSLVPAQGTLNF
jgi:uroporphyrin-III C-methyltransferase/precorrin-2 dehydrogenase/sirohydrochlorin ferrochelatase